MPVFSKLLKEPPRLCRHIPSLLSVAALAAQHLIDLDAAKDAASRAMCQQLRGGLSDKLLDYCDDIYGDLADDPQCHTGELAWITESFGVDLHSPRTTPFAEKLLSLINHVHLHSDVDALIANLVRDLSLCTRFVIREHPHLMQAYELMLTRLYGRVNRAYGCDSVIVSSITKAVLDVSVPRNVRDLVMRLDSCYESHIRRYMDEIQDKDKAWLFGINAGRLDLTVGKVPLSLTMECRIEWMLAACYTGDVDVLENVMFPFSATEFRRIEGNDRKRLIRIASITSNVPVLKFLFERTIGGFGVMCEDVWKDVRDVECARVLVQHGYPTDYALARCSRSPAVVQFLLASGARVEPTDGLCAQCEYDPCVIDLLVEAWKCSEISLARFVSVALHYCVSPDVFRRVVRSVDGAIVRSVLVRRSPEYFLFSSTARRNVACMKVYFQYGARVDAVDNESGRSMLLIAAAHGMMYAVKYLMNIGASCSLRDNGGLSVYDLLCTDGFSIN